jgi:predicted nucleic-acid-binding Zn-ribbon protein
MRQIDGSCPRCGNTKQVRGKLPNISFVPDAKPKRAFAVWPAVAADACIQCGHLELKIEPETLISILGESPTSLD